ncbi:MAG: hypothetical protein OIN89_10660 [Candidatus Methanoperedens sp.]|jgi:hypothetical protein|nr:hypothetical protein [Candidatus Methanoperedens sp.]PKL53220.1 MAG: hypothetical protein CVV36_08345 [Candidatus Methanoperedenaceae archaeon HGW-Methanoperedenaceae-1]
MSIRKNISLEKNHLDKLDPLITKNKGNFSAAIREIIDLIDTMLNNPDDISKVIDGLKTDYNFTENIIYWLIKQSRGKLIEQEVLDNIIDPTKIVLLTDLEKYLDDMTNGGNWQTSIKISDYDNNVMPSSVNVVLTGHSVYKMEFLGGIISSFLVTHKKQEVFSMKREANKIIIAFKQQNNTNLAKHSLVRHFGYMEDIMREISKNHEFWKCIGNLYRQTNYNMVVIPKKYYNELLTGTEVPGCLTAPIEAIHRIPIKDIPLEKLIRTMKSVYEHMGIVERIDMDENTLNIYHGYSDPRAIQAIEKLLMGVLDTHGTKYESCCSENLIVLSRVNTGVNEEETCLLKVQAV